MPVTDAEIDHVLALERELQSPQARSDAGRVAELLTPTFLEIGASGRRWDRDAIRDLLEEEVNHRDAEPNRMLVLEARVLTDDVIQVFWTSERAGRRARRTSLWQRLGDRWRQTYHQGTPLP